MAVRLSAVLVAACFGPYIFGAVRPDQAVFYGLALLGLLGTARGRVHLPPRIAVVGGLWALIAVVGIVGGVLPGSAALDSGSLVSGLDALLLPLAVVVVFLLWVAPRGPEAISSVERTIVVLMAVNAGVALVSTLTDTSELLRPFWSADTLDVTVAERALSQGRFGGIFNQPLEAGVAYSLALILCLRQDEQQRPWLATAIIVGGVLSTSKVFLLVGAPIALGVAVVSQAGRRRRLLTIGVGATVLIVFIALTGGPTWTGSNRLLDLMAPSADGVTHRLSAGRYGKAGEVGATLSETMKASPLTGLGAGGLSGPMDSAYLEILARSGLIGLAAYLLILAVMGVVALGINRGVDRRVPVATWLLTCAAGLGGPVLTLNRTGPLIWLVLLGAFHGSTDTLKAPEVLRNVPRRRPVDS